MPTFTNRLGLIKPSGGENVDVDQLNANFDRLDAKIATVVCTSTTRPTGTDRYQGLVIYETDTGNTYVWDGTGWVWIGGKENADTYHSFTTPAKNGWRVATQRKRISDRALLFEAMAFPVTGGGVFSASATFNEVADGWISGTNDTDYPEWTRTNSVGSGIGSSYILVGAVSGSAANQDCHFSIGANGSVGLRIQANLTLSTNHRFYCPPIILMRT